MTRPILRSSLAYARTSRVAGYCASAFILLHYFANFLLGSYAAEFEFGKLPDWMPMVWGWLMLLAAFSAVVCLASGLLGFLRHRKHDVVNEVAV